MKFAGSNEESTLNYIWNKTVVARDHTVRGVFNGVRFFDLSQDILQCILYYRNSVMNFISNGSRRCAKYEDREYIINYFRQASEDAVCDLTSYKGTISRRKYYAGCDVIIDDYIREVEALVASLAATKGPQGAGQDEEMLTKLNPM